MNRVASGERGSPVRQRRSAGAMVALGKAMGSGAKRSASASLERGDQEEFMQPGWGVLVIPLLPEPAVDRNAT